MCASQIGGRALIGAWALKEMNTASGNDDMHNILDEFVVKSPLKAPPLGD